MIMKKFLLFLAVIAVTSAAVSCNKTPEPSPSNDPSSDTSSQDPGQPSEQKSNKCDILSFTVLAGGTEVPGDVSPAEKKVVLPYYPEDAAAMKSAKASYSLSEGAVISPDPSKEDFDYTRELKFTVTAEDGTTTKEYTVSSREYEVTLGVEKVWPTAKTLVQLGVTPSQLDKNTQLFAFAGTDKFVAPDLQVFDLNGNKVGKLNTDGIPAGWVVTGLTNDKNGIVLAAFSGVFTGGDKTQPDDVVEGGIYVWTGGYDAAPEVLWTISSSQNNDLFPVGGNRDFYELKVGGDMKGDFIVTTYHFLEWQSGPGLGAYADHGMFNCFCGSGGNLSSAVHDVAHTCHDAGDGNVWQILIPVSSDKDGQFVVVDSGSPGGIRIYIQEGTDYPSTDTPLYGTLTAEFVGEEGAEGFQNYGNYSPGDAVVFNFHGTDYLFAATTFWQGQYMTIQTLDSTDDSHYVYETNYVSYLNENRVSAAAVVDPESDTVKLLYGTNLAGGGVLLYEIVRNVI